MARTLTARFPWVCSYCGQRENAGKEFTWNRRPSVQDKASGKKKYYHPDCLDKYQQGIPFTATQDTRGTVFTEPIPVTQEELTENEELVAQAEVQETIGAVNTLETLARSLQPYLQIEPENDGIDETAVRSIVQEVLADMRPTVLQVTIPDGTTKEINGPLHHKFSDLVKLIGARKNVMLVGPSQSGKSFATNQAAELNKLPYYYVSLNPQTPDSRIMGFIRPDGTPQKTVFAEAYENGGVICFDEVDNTSDSLLTTINNALSSKKASFPWGMVDKHPDFVCVATANTNGQGGTPDYPDRRVLSVAFRQRFWFVEWGYDENLEREIVKGINPKAIPFMSWVQQVRRDIAGKGLRGIAATPTASFGFAELHGHFTPEQIADMVVFKCCKADLRDKVLAERPLPIIAEA